MSNFDLKQRYNRNEFDNFIRTFLPDDYTRKETQVTPIGFRPQYATDITLIGVCKSLNLDVYEIHHSSVADARVGIANDTFKLLQHNSLNNNALVAFIPKEGDGQWRFSLLQIELDAVEQSSRIKRSYSNPRRYSYVLGPDAHVRTPEKFLIDTGKIRERRDGNKTLSPFEDLQSRFSVEVLSKEFYRNLFHWYLWATQHPSVSFPDKEYADAGKDKSVKIIRLITRMLFVWFIKQKGLVPGNLFDTNEIAKVLKTFDADSSQSSTYYNAILQNLFFATLNRPVVEVDEDGVEKVRKFAKNQYGEDTKNLYRYEDLFSISKEEIVKLFDPIPFLNSSLFDCLDKSKKLNNVEKCFKYDGFSRNSRKQAQVPNELFFGKEQIIKLKVGNEDKEPVLVQGLVRLFEQYNFTIEENSPREVEVSLDPELLGRVFENLLAAYNPETGESVRKSTGSFYTPREIVNYMVNESLVAYLKDKTQVSETDLRLLLSYDDDVPSLSNDQKQQLENAIKECKVLDPACGSGAFPMGMLQQMVHLWERVFPAASTGYTSRQTAMYERKLYLIEHCIFGVDIQPIAMLISKLRFFISLICEQPKADFDLKKRKENYGVNTLPALETKFVAANTLIPAAVRNFDDDWSQDDNLIKLKNELLEIRHNNFVSQSYSRNQRLIKKSQEKCQEIRDYIMENSYKPNQQRIEMLEAQIAKLEAKKLEYAGERWVEEAVIGDLFGAGTEEPKKHDANLTKRKEIDKAIENCRLDIEKEQQKSAPQGFEKAVTELTAWDPYDQNTSSPFFDAEWMFGIEINRPDESNGEKGFDIVIGNPPYISAPKQIASPDLNEQRKKIVNCNRYKSLHEKWDLYIPFMELGLQFLCPDGVLSMIVPYPLTNQKYGKILRKMIVKDYRMLEIADLNGTKIFENATVSNCIPFVSKANTIGKTWISHINNNWIVYRVFEQPHTDLVQDENTQVWNLTQEKRETNRHAGMHVLGDYCYISKGMVLHSEKGEFTKDDLISIVKDDVHCKKYVEAKDIERYNIKRVRFLEYYTNRCPQKLSRPTFPELYECEKIIMNCLGGLNSTIGTKYTHNHSLYCSVLWKDLHKVENKSITSSIRKYSTMTRAQMEKLSQTVDLRYLLGIMNSKYASVLLTNLRGGDYHIYPEHIRNIPIPSATLSQQKEIILLVNIILSKKKANPQNDTSAEEKKIDKLVYELYRLEPEEIRIVEEQ